MNINAYHYDSGWKDIIEEYFPEFLDFFFNDIYVDIDFNKKYEFLDKELEKIVKDSEIGKRYADKLVKVFLKTGEEKWLLIHIEVQGSFDKEFSERMYVYNYRIFDKYHKEVISLAILADENKNFRPDNYDYKKWGFSRIFRFPVVKLLDYYDKMDELAENNNPFSIAVLTHLRAMESKSDPEKRLFWKLTLVKNLYKRGFSKQDVINLYRFIDWIVSLPMDLEIKFKEEIEKFEEEVKVPYISTIERMGIEKGKLELAKKLLGLGVDIKIISKASGMSEEEIKKLLN